MTSCSRRLGEGWVVIRLARKRSRSSERNQSTVPLSEPPTSTQGAMYRTGMRSSPPVIAAAPADTSTAHAALIDIHPEFLETAQVSLPGCVHRGPPRIAAGSGPTGDPLTPAGASPPPTDP